ncbi:MAG: protein kinase, partial [Sandaracinaceae bacterium]|nr:protein kinase [Sandaracinaceae bacterium]
MSSPASMVRDLTGRRLGRYEVLAQLAAGGMATVYAARAQGVAGFERLVAIKVLHPHLAHDDEFISMFLDEARLAARIRHPNVVPTLDISDSQGDGYFLVMEYIEGDHFGSLLREAARAGKNVPPGVALRVVVDALEGLGAAHGLADPDGKPLGIVHRDISPHNILVGSDGIARITDFGVAKAEVRLSSTRDGQFKGKLAYMAPEQASTGFADQRSDLFGMGVVLWESLVGRRLFKAENNGELLNRLLYAAIPAPSEYVPELAPLDGVLAKALEREADARFQSASEFIDAIEEAAAQIGGVGNQRAVGRSVKELLGAKIGAESTRIRTAIDSLGRSEVSSAGAIPRPEPSGLLAVGGVLPSGERSSASQPSQVRRAAPEDMTVGAKPTTLEHEHEQGSRSKTPLVIAGVVVVLLALAGVGWALTQSSGETAVGPTTPPLTSPVAPPPSTPAATTTVAEPTGTGTTATGGADQVGAGPVGAQQGSEQVGDVPPT